MFKYNSVISVLLLFLIALAADAFDVTKVQSENLFLTDKDIVPKDELDLQTRDNKDQYRFIGDLIIGNHHADETVFRRNVEVANPTDQVYSSTITLNVERGAIHYLSVTNERDSYAVACDEPYSLGGSRISFNVRAPPNTKSNLRLFVAAH